MDGEYSKALIYCRVSSDRQVNEGHGLESQEYRCREYAESLGLSVENVFREEGVSGGLFDRPAMKSLIAYLDKHWQYPYVVIFDDLKRFARDVSVHLRLKQELMGRRAKLRCLNYNFDDSAEGEFVETIFAAQNELERKQNQRQVLQKMRVRVERGYWCFGPPAAFKYTKDKEHGKILAPIQPAAGIIGDGITGFAKDRFRTQSDVLEFFKEQDLYTLLGRNPKHLDLDFVKDVLTQPLYAGMLELKRWGISRRKAHHQGIVSEGVHYESLRKLERTERKNREGETIEFPLRRLIACSLCGKNYTASVSKGKRKYYAHYTCNNKLCAARPKNIMADTLEREYVALLESIRVDREILEMGKLIATRIWEEKIKHVSDDQSQREAEKQALERRIDEYIELVPAAPSMSIKARYEAKIAELDQQIKTLDVPTETQKAPDFDEALSLTLRLLGTPAETWLASDKQSKTVLHNLMFAEKLTYSVNTGFGTPKLSLPFLLNELVPAHEGNLVDRWGFEPHASAMQTRRSTK